MSGGRDQISRRAFLSGSATLLAGHGVSRVPSPGTAPASTPAKAPGAAAAGRAPSCDLALYRPVTVSSTAYGPNPPAFAVDRLAHVGPRGTGWRAGGPDPQWISVDLQADCTVETVVLVFEATSGDPEWVPAQGSDPYASTTGWEVMSSYATAFQLDISTDGTTWRTIYQTTSGTGGEVHILLAEPVTARWVRMTATRQSNGSPLQVNGFQVYGTSEQLRPPVTGWTNWGSRPPAAPPELTTALDGTVPIESGWALTLDDWAGTTEGACLSTTQADTAGWIQATVPGTVLASLVEQGLLPDPVAGYNNLHIPEALARHSWWYRRAFRLPEGFDTSPGRHVWLELDGINHHADIWLNGQHIGELTHPSARGAFDISAALADGEQVLAVQITPMPHPGSPGDKGPSGVSFLYSQMVSLDFPGYISVSGWDWMPAVRDRAAGIWDHVRLRSTGPAVLSDPRVDTSLANCPDTSVADVTVVVPVRNASSAPQSVAVSAAFDSVQVTTTVTLAAGAAIDVTFSPADIPALRVRNPRLWWPNGYGEPALHDLIMTASLHGAESDRRTRRFGLRQVDYDLPPLRIKVNGVPIFCRGGNWGWDELLRRMLPDRMGDVLRMHRDMNFTMIRNWGGCSTREEFYSGCDENGILAWTEFWEGDGLFPGEQSTDVFLAQAADTVLRYRIHPSIVVWCGANESYPPAAVDTGLRQAVRRSAPGTLYHSNSAADGTSSGGPYEWVDPAQYFSGVQGGGEFGFHTEIGQPTVPVADSMRDLIGATLDPDAGLRIQNPWFLHDWCTRGNQRVDTYQAAIETRLGTADGLDDFCVKAQFVNYENIRAMFEAWNTKLWNDASGLLLWMSNPAHHSTVWQTYDYDLDVNGTYYGARKGCEAIHVQASLTDWHVLVINHTPRPLDGATVAAGLYDLSGKPLAAPQSEVVTAGAASATPAFAVAFDACAPSPHLLRLRLTGQQGQLLSENTYWRYRDARDMQALNQLPQVPVTASVSRGGHSGRAQEQLTVTLSNHGPAVAAMVVLSLRDSNSGQRILPAQYSDNYAWMLPGETRVVTARWPSGRQPVSPAIRISGYNVRPQTYRAP